MRGMKKSYDELNEIFSSHRIRFALGRDFYPKQQKGKYLRMSIASLNENEIVEGVARFSKAVKQIYKN